MVVLCALHARLAHRLGGGLTETHAQRRSGLVLAARAEQLDVAVQFAAEINQHACRTVGSRGGQRARRYRFAEPDLARRGSEKPLRMRDASGALPEDACGRDEEL